jgi:hypothetical protein
MLQTADSLKQNTVITHDTFKPVVSQPVTTVTNVSTSLNSAQSAQQTSSTVLVKPKEKVIDEKIPYSNSYELAPWADFVSSNNYLFTKNLKKKEAYIYTEKDTVKTALYQYVNKQHSSNFKFFENNLLLVLLLTSFILLAWTKSQFGKYVTQILRAVLNYNDAYKLYRDQNALIDRVYFIVNVIFILSGGLYCYHLLYWFKPTLLQHRPFLIMMFCFSFILGLFFFRYVVNKVLGYVLQQFKTFDEYIHSSFIYYKAFGLFLLPLVSIISFISEKYRFVFIVFGIVIFFLLYFISIFRATRIMLQKGVLLFYWILYLCTVEFLPILLLYKFFNTVV